MTVYDEIGTTYAAVRRPDPRLAARITAALGDAATVVNVGAGTGSYEPPAPLLAVEPSTVMIAQRPPGSAPVVRARAEALPLADGVADAAMALLTGHHSTTPDTGCSSPTCERAWDPRTGGVRTSWGAIEEAVSC